MEVGILVVKVFKISQVPRSSVCLKKIEPEAPELCLNTNMGGVFELQLMLVYLDVYLLFMQLIIIASVCTGKTD